jgi:hypothetical protein
MGDFVRFMINLLSGEHTQAFGAAKKIVAGGAALAQRFRDEFETPFPAGSNRSVKLVKP